MHERKHFLVCDMHWFTGDCQESRLGYFISKKNFPHAWSWQTTAPPRGCFSCSSLPVEIRFSLPTFTKCFIIRHHLMVGVLSLFYGVVELSQSLTTKKEQAYHLNRMSAIQHQQQNNVHSNAQWATAVRKNFLLTGRILRQNEAQGGGGAAKREKRTKTGQKTHRRRKCREEE